MYTPFAGSNSCSGRKFKVGNVNFRPVPVPATTSPVNANARPSIRAARVTSPSEINFRITVLETISPSTTTGSCTITSNPSRIPNSRKSFTFPACLCPNRKLSPTTTARTCNCRTKISPTKSSGDNCDNSLVNGSTTAAPTPSAPNHSSLCSFVEIRGGADSGRNTFNGGGSNVSAVATAPRSFASSMQYSSSLWCPKCIPSKFPIAITLPRPRVFSCGTGTPACVLGVLFSAPSALFLSELCVKSALVFSKCFRPLLPRRKHSQPTRRPHLHPWPLRLHLKRQPVISQLHIRISQLPQPLIRSRMPQIMRNMRKPGPLRPQLINYRQRLLHRHMHRMRHIPQRIQNQIVQSLQQRSALLRQPAEICQIRRPPKPVSQHFHLSMHQRHGNELDAHHLKRPLHHMQMNARNAAQRRLVVKHIRKRPPHNLKRLFTSIHRHCRPLLEVVRPQIVKSQNMIRMPVRQQNRIQPVDPGPQSLRPEIRRRINHHIVPAVRKQQGRPQPLIMRILRLAHRAMTPQSRHAHRRPRPQHGHPHPLARHVPHCNQPASNLAFVGTLCTLWHLCVLCVNSSPSFPKNKKSQAPPSSTWDPTQKPVILKLSDKVRCWDSGGFHRR